MHRSIRRPSMLLRELGGFARRHAARAFWLVMLLGHFPAARAALVNLGADGPGIALPRLLLLLASLVFFSLKVANVAWLRLPRDRRVVSAVVAIFVLLHADVVRRSLREDARQAESTPVAVLTVATVIVAAICVRTTAGHWETSTRALNHFRRLLSICIHQSASRSFQFRNPAFARPALGLRAPPR